MNNLNIDILTEMKEKIVDEKFKNFIILQKNNLEKKFTIVEWLKLHETILHTVTNTADRTIYYRQYISRRLRRISKIEWKILQNNITFELHLTPYLQPWSERLYLIFCGRKIIIYVSWFSILQPASLKDKLLYYFQCINFQAPQLPWGKTFI